MTNKIDIDKYNYLRIIKIVGNYICPFEGLIFYLRYYSTPQKAHFDFVDEKILEAFTDCYKKSHFFDSYEIYSQNGLNKILLGYEGSETKDMCAILRPGSDVPWEEFRKYWINDYQDIEYNFSMRVLSGFNGQFPNAFYKDVVSMIPFREKQKFCNMAIAV